jgi:hypothetical protein
MHAALRATHRFLTARFIASHWSWWRHRGAREGSFLLADSAGNAVQEGLTLEVFATGRRG